MYAALQSIRPYVAPLYLVEPVGEVTTDPAEIRDALDTFAHVVTVDTNIKGWGDFNCIIRGTDERGEDRYYLALSR